MWPENLPAVSAFLAAATQWRTVALPSGFILTIGLDYSAARVGIEAAGMTITPELWAGLREMEAEARNALNADSP